MSRHLIYDRMSIQVSTDQFMTLVLSGDSNVYEAGHQNKRARSWNLFQLDEGMPWDTLAGWTERVDSYVQGQVKNGVSCLDGLYYKGRVMTFRMVKSMFVSSAKKPFSIDQLVENHSGLIIYAPKHQCLKFGIEPDKYTIQRGDDFQQVYLQFVSKYSRFGIPVLIGASQTDELAVRMRKKYYCAVYEEYHQDHFYTIKIDGDYFIRLTARGCQYSKFDLPSYQAPSKSAATSQVKRILRSFPDAQLDIEKVNQPATFRRRIS